MQSKLITVFGKLLKPIRNEYGILLLKVRCSYFFNRVCGLQSQE